MAADSTANGQPMVELRQVSKRYGDVFALASVDLTVRKGEFVTLLGPSGSGKTTLLNLIAGMTPPTSGSITIDGRDATALPPSQRGLGMVFQNYALMPHMTVFENIAFPLRVRKMSNEQVAHKVNEVLKLIRLPGIAQRKPRELSGGQQQRVALARCIVYNPSLILLDEPLGALDKKLREQMQLEIKRIHAELGITMLNVTHDQDEALTLSDRIVLMNGGRVEQQCGPEELYFQPCSVFAAGFIGDANLFEAKVSGVEPALVQLACCEGRATSGLPAFAVKPGDSVMLLVRPENMRLLAAGDGTKINTVEGTLRDSIVLGGAVKHHVTLRSGAEVVMQESNHVGRVALRRGQAVHLGWSAQDSVVLPPGTAAS
jgi:putative spermidine/putrescine transport system ATP-binding protein